VDSIPDVGSPGAGAGLPARVPRVTLPAEAPPSSFGLILDGFIRVPRSGIYTFFLSSDDGSRLELAGGTVVDHDGYHGMSEKQGQAALRRGWHPIRILFFQGGGGAGVRLEMEGPGMPRREVPARWFAHSGTGAFFPGDGR
jgi:hexosaminidase